MDPDACLEELRSLCQTGGYKGRMIELIDSLDLWLSKGGFLPKRWSDAEPQIEYRPCFCGSPTAKGYHAAKGCTLH